MTPMTTIEERDNSREASEKTVKTDTAASSWRLPASLSAIPSIKGERRRKGRLTLKQLKVGSARVSTGSQRAS